MNKSFEIESDCLDIVKRIKAIDKDYFILFNLDKQKLELHNKSQEKNTYCMTLPFDCLDERSVQHVLETRVQNFDEIFKNMEIDNMQLKQKNISKVLNDFKEKLYDS